VCLLLESGAGARNWRPVVRNILTLFADRRRWLAVAAMLTQISTLDLRPHCEFGKLCVLK